jgi:16S rRNA processing protein RimM
MLLAAHLAKVQGLKGEFLLHALTDSPERLPEIQGLVLAPPDLDLQFESGPVAPARTIEVAHFRWHQTRPCLALVGIADRTQAEAYKGWALWLPEDQGSLEAGESYRHDWVGCEVFVEGRKVGEVLHLEATPMGYDMVVMRDMRPGRTGRRDLPYIKAWWQVDLPGRRLDLDPPPGLLDLDRLED